MISLPRETIARMYRKGASMYALAREFGVTRPTIRLILVEEGVRIRPTTNGVGNGRSARVQAVLARHGDAIAAGYAAGLSMEVLADRYPLSETTIRHYLAERGVPRRTFAEAQAVRRAQGR